MTHSRDDMTADEWADWAEMDRTNVVPQVSGPGDDCPEGWHEHSDVTVRHGANVVPGSAEDPEDTVNQHDQAAPVTTSDTDLGTDLPPMQKRVDGPDKLTPYTPEWMVSLFDGIQTALDMTRESALAAAGSDDPRQWNSLTAVMASMVETFDRVGHSFAHHTSELAIGQDRHPLELLLETILGGSVGVQVVDMRTLFENTPNPETVSTGTLGDDNQD